LAFGPRNQQMYNAMVPQQAQEAEFLLGAGQGKGVIRNIPPMQLPPGAFWSMSNYIAGMAGLVRRPGLSLGSSAPVLYPPARDLLTIWGPDGTLYVLVMDMKFLYAMTGNSMTPVYWKFTSSCNVAGSASSTITFHAALNTWQKQLRAGDTLYAYSGAITLLAERAITNITSTTITLSGGALGANLAGKTFDIRRAFGAANPYMVDYALIPGGQVVLTDSTHMPMLYSTAALTMGLFNTLTAGNSTTNFAPTCVTSFKDRLWCGLIRTPGNAPPTRYYNQRITWSQPLSKTNFSTIQYVDLPYFPGTTKRMMGLGQLLAAYFDDSVYIGQPTGIAGNQLPYSFFRLDTGGVGLAGMKAVCQWQNGHFLVGDDNVYFLDANLNFNPIGTQIARDYVRYKPNSWAAYACPDPQNYRILFGIPNNASTFDNLLSFDYITKTWSVDTVPGCGMISRKIIFFNKTWSTILAAPPYTWTTGMTIYPTWLSMTQKGAPPTYIAKSNVVLYYNTSVTADASSPGQGIAANFTTGGLAMELGGRLKTFLEFVLEIDRIMPGDLSFTVYGSKDAGATWVNLTANRALVIKAGSTSSATRFRFTQKYAWFQVQSATQCAPYAISRFAVYWIDRGRYIHYAGTE
jgi:hypothetical protein